MEAKVTSKSVKPTKSQKMNTLRVPAPVPARVISRRKVAIILVCVAICLMLYPSVKIAFQKQAEVAAAKADIVRQQEEHAFLTQQVARWQDQNFIRQEARTRINMVMPGETAYWVTGENLNEETEESTKQESEKHSNWVSRLVDSSK